GDSPGRMTTGELPPGPMLEGPQAAVAVVVDGDGAARVCTGPQLPVPGVGAVDEFGVEVEEEPIASVASRGDTEAQGGARIVVRGATGELLTARLVTRLQEGARVPGRASR